MALSATGVKNAKPSEKPYKVMDSEGLYLLVKPNGSKLWRMNYVFAGKQKTLSFGVYPAVELAEAREKRNEARKALLLSVDPSEQKKARDRATVLNAKNTFESVVDDYLKVLAHKKRTEKTVWKNRWMLKTLAADLLPKPCADITSADVLAVLKHVERSGRLETARRLRSVISSVFSLAVSTLRATTDPTYPLRESTLAPIVKHRSAITDESKFGRLLVNLDDYDGWPTLRLALKLIALTAVRPVEVRLATWKEFDLEKRVWTIPSSRMKMRHEHQVPLSDQMVSIIREIEPFSGRGELIFPSIRSSTKALSENAMNSALRRMGYTKDQHCAHGFRSSFSTIMNSRGFDPEVIEVCLAHKDGSVRGIYNRSRYWDQRVTLMQTWSNLCDEFRRQ